MRIQKLFVLTAFLSMIFAVQSFAQSEAQIKGILAKFKNYRYGNISVFKLDDETMKNVTELLNPQPQITETAKTCVPGKQAQIDDAVAVLGCAATIEALLNDPDISKLLRGECMDYAKFSVQHKQWECNNFRNAFVITTRYSESQPFTIIGLITSNSESKKLTTVLGVPRDIYTYTQLRQQQAPAGSSSKTLYDYLRNFVVQQHNADDVNVTADAQGIGDEVFIKAIRGLTTQVNDQDVEMYKRISEGQAMEYTKPNELIVSPDLISYRNYAPKENAEVQVGADSIFNKLTPRIGAELRYGVDPANIPSFLSDRMSLNAIWGWNKLGVVLPTSGWASFGKQLGMTPRLTHAGFGLDASFDFPIDVTNSNTGVFNLAGSYVFSDAKESDHPLLVQSFGDQYPRVDTLKKGNPDTLYAAHTRNSQISNDYLLRVNAQLQYTFAVKIDSGNYFRFRIGGSMYSMETWAKEIGTERIDTLLGSTRKGDTTLTVDTYKKVGTKTIGGVSVRIDYMSMYVSTPYGFGLQYFDDALYGNAWLLIPISPSLGVRVEGVFTTPVLRNPYDWENKTTFVPTARIIYNF